MAKTPQNIANAGVPPARVLKGQGDNEGGKLACGPWTTRAASGRPIVLLSNQLPIPAQNRIGVDDASKLAKATAADGLAPSSETATLSVRETKALVAKVFTEDFVLFLKLLKHNALLSSKPAGDKRDDEMQRPDLHQETLARSALNVRDAHHGRSEHLCGIMGRSSLCTRREATVVDAFGGNIEAAVGVLRAPNSIIRLWTEVTHSPSHCATALKVCHLSFGTARGRAPCRAIYDFSRAFAVLELPIFP